MPTPPKNFRQNSAAARTPLRAAPPDENTGTIHYHQIASLVICLIAIAHGMAAHLIARTMSATYDEPMHAFCGAMILQHGDYRAGYDHPPLIHILSALPHRSSARVDRDAPLCKALGRDAQMLWLLWDATVHQLYRQATFDGVAFVNDARIPMAFIAAVGVLLVGLATRAIAGPLAGILAAFIMAVDPNFLAHGSLVKNDVAISVCYLGVAWLAWIMLHKLTWLRTVGLGVLFGLSLLSKFSGVLLIGCVMVILLIRAIHAVPWPTGGDAILNTRGQRLGRWFAVAGTAGVVCYLVIWAGYGFSYHASPTGSGDPINTAGLIEIYRDRTDNAPLPLSMRLICWANEWHLVPEAFANGLVFQQATVHERISYIMGRQYAGGNWYYFPIAVLVKTPVGTVLMAGLTALLLGRVICRRSGQRTAEIQSLSSSLSAAAVFGTIGIAYGITSVMLPLNVGIRHLLPMYPLGIAGLGWAMSRMIAGRGAKRWIGFALLALTTAESAANTPGQLCFFNSVATAFRPAAWWLGDSNLDWGQGLNALADWQRNGRSDRPLYLAYFGLADPSRYGVRYINLPYSDAFHGTAVSWNMGGYEFAPAGDMPDFDSAPGYIAISVTRLQGILMRRDMYAAFREEPPLAVLGGSIYVYSTDSPAGKTLPRPLPASRQDMSP